MPDDDKRYQRTTPAKQEDWPYIWDGLSKAQKLWKVGGWAYAILENWKAWAIAAAILVWVQNEKILAALRTLTGIG